MGTLTVYGSTIPEKSFTYRDDGELWLAILAVNDYLASFLPTWKDAWDQIRPEPPRDRE